MLFYFFGLFWSQFAAYLINPPLFYLSEWNTGTPSVNLVLFQNSPKCKLLEKNSYHVWFTCSNIFFFIFVHCSLSVRLENMIFNSKLLQRTKLLTVLIANRFKSIIKICETGFMSLQKFKISPQNVILTIQARRKISKVALPFKHLTLYISTKQNG